MKVTGAVVIVVGVGAYGWIRHVSVTVHHQDLIKGIVQWKTLVFYGSTTFFFLFLSVRGVESHKWR